MQHFFFQYCRQYCRHGCGLFFVFFFSPDSSNLTRTSEEILQWYSSTYSDYSEGDYMCVPWLLGPDCCRSVADRKTQWLCYQEHYEKAEDFMCSCADERIISEQEKKKNQSPTRDDWLNWKQNTEKTWWHMPFYLSVMCKNVSFLKCPNFIYVLCRDIQRCRLLL